MSPSRLNAWLCHRDCHIYLLSVYSIYDGEWHCHSEPTNLDHNKLDSRPYTMSRSQIAEEIRGAFGAQLEDIIVDYLSGDNAPPFNS